MQVLQSIVCCIILTFHTLVHGRSMVLPEISFPRICRSPVKGKEVFDSFSPERSDLENPWHSPQAPSSRSHVQVERSADDVLQYRVATESSSQTLESLKDYNEHLLPLQHRWGSLQKRHQSDHSAQSCNFYHLRNSDLRTVLVRRASRRFVLPSNFNLDMRL